MKLNRVLLVSVAVFILVWTLFLALGFTALICKNPAGKPAHKRFFCNISLAAGSLGIHDHRTKSFLYLERGIAFERLGATDDAYSDVKRSIALTYEYRRWTEAPFYKRVRTRIEERIESDDYLDDSVKNDWRALLSVEPENQ